MSEQGNLNPRAECARCRQWPPMHSFLGCLCEECEDAIEGMSQAELDADYEAHAALSSSGEEGE